jgi:hypothetical protein
MDIDRHHHEKTVMIHFFERPGPYFVIQIVSVVRRLTFLKLVHNSRQWMEDSIPIEWNHVGEMILPPHLPVTSAVKLVDDDNWRIHLDFAIYHPSYCVAPCLAVATHGPWY